MKVEDIKVALIGLGYVGLPLAVEFGKKRPVLGFDINQKRITELQDGQDHTLEVSDEELAEAKYLRFSSDPAELAKVNTYIVTVPTPIDEYKRPDLTPLVKASETIGRVLKKGDIVIYESTVYPGATEEDCVPVLEKVSGLTFNVDFFAGYSPERINPGDKAHRVSTIKKVTAGSTPEVAEVVDQLYREIIVAGRRLNDSMGTYVVAELVKAMTKKCIQVQGAKVLVMGLTFKENCPDLRNTRVVDIIKELDEYSMDVDVFDPWVDAEEAKHEYGITPVKTVSQGVYDSIVLAVSHQEFVEMGAQEIRALGKPECVLYDLKYVLEADEVDVRL